MHSVITIFCAFTRRWAVEPWLENLEKLKHEPALTNLAIIVDCEEPYIANAIKKFAEQKGYRSFHVKINSEWHPNEVQLKIRRHRVADVHNQSKDLIALTDGEYVFGLEDDTVLRSDETLMQLLHPFKDNSLLGFVEGVQMGRWGANMIGAWTFDNPSNPKQVSTLLPGDGYQEITGGGFYCYVTPRELYLNHEYYTSTAQPWGPDVNYGVWLSQQGYHNLICWEAITGHRDYSKTLYPDDEGVRLAQIVYNKNEITGKWDRTDHERDRF